MRNRAAILCVVLSLFHLHAFADDAIPTAAVNITWSVESGIDHQIFPSATIMTATSKIPFAYLVVRVSNLPAGSKATATVKCDSLIDESSAEASAATGITTIPIKANWKFDRLAAIHQQTPINFTYTLSVDGKEIGQKTDTATVHSINDCLYEYLTPDGKIKKLFYMFAGYVNENNPEIDLLLKEALKTGIVKNFAGYQSNDPKDVAKQVFSIWYALEKKGIKYSNITDIPKQSERIVAQHVRFPDESIDNAQANCVDGSVLLASILEKIGIDCSLVATSNHMFLIFYAQPGHKSPIPLETTMMGNVDLSKDATKTPNILEAHLQSHASATNFLAAVRNGLIKIAQLEEEGKKAKANQSNEFVGEVIDLGEARKFGIMPIPFTSAGK